LGYNFLFETLKLDVGTKQEIEITLFSSIVSVG